MLYAMLLGRYPFDSNMPDQLRLRVMTERPLEGAEGLSAECQELLEGMLHPNQHERMTVARIKQHPWFLRCVRRGLGGVEAGKAMAEGRQVCHKCGICVWGEFYNVCRYLSRAA